MELYLVSMVWRKKKLKCGGKKCQHLPVAVHSACYKIHVFDVMVQEAGARNFMF